MSFENEEIERETARRVMAECAARLHHAVRHELAKDVIDPDRLAGLRLAEDEVRRERKEVSGGNRAAIAKAYYFYGLLLKQVHYPHSRESLY